MRINSPTNENLEALLSSIAKGPWTVQPFTTGNTNSVSMIKSPTHTFILRIFGSEGLIDRCDEFLNIKLLSHLGLAPNIAVIFENGMITEFIEGTQLDDEEMKANSKDILNMLLKWHSLDIKINNNLVLQHPYLDLGSTIARFKSRKPLLIPTIEKWYALAVAQHSDLLLRFNIKERIDEVKKDTSGCKVTFCHNDLLSSNIIRRTDGDVFFIDYEYAGFNFQCFDIANHFAEYAGYDLRFEEIPNRERVRDILTGFEDAFIDEVMYFIPLSHLFWGVWALLREGTFDYHNYGRMRLEAFDSSYRRLCRK